MRSQVRLSNSALETGDDATDGEDNYNSQKTFSKSEPLKQNKKTTSGVVIGNYHVSRRGLHIANGL